MVVSQRPGSRVPTQQPSSQTITSTSPIPATPITTSPSPTRTAEPTITAQFVIRGGESAQRQYRELGRLPSGARLLSQERLTITIQAPKSEFQRIQRELKLEGGYALKWSAASETGQLSIPIRQKIGESEYVDPLPEAPPGQVKQEVEVTQPPTGAWTIKRVLTPQEVEALKTPQKPEYIFRKRGKFEGWPDPAPTPQKVYISPEEQIVQSAVAPARGIREIIRAYKPFQKIQEARRKGVEIVTQETDIYFNPISLGPTLPGPIKIPLPIEVTTSKKKKPYTLKIPEEVQKEIINAAPYVIGAPLVLDIAEVGEKRLTGKVLQPEDYATVVIGGTYFAIKPLSKFTTKAYQKAAAKFELKKLKTDAQALQFSKPKPGTGDKVIQTEATLYGKAEAVYINRFGKQVEKQYDVLLKGKGKTLQAEDIFFTKAKDFGVLQIRAQKGKAPYQFQVAKQDYPKVAEIVTGKEVNVLSTPKGAAISLKGKGVTFSIVDLKGKVGRQTVTSQALQIGRKTNDEILSYSFLIPSKAKVKPGSTITFLESQPLIGFDQPILEAPRGIISRGRYEKIKVPSKPEKYVDVDLSRTAEVIRETRVQINPYRIDRVGLRKLYGPNLLEPPKRIKATYDYAEALILEEPIKGKYQFFTEVNLGDVFLPEQTAFKLLGKETGIITRELKTISGAPYYKLGDDPFVKLTNIEIGEGPSLFSKTVYDRATDTLKKVTIKVPPLERGTQVRGITSWSANGPLGLSKVKTVSFQAPQKITKKVKEEATRKVASPKSPESIVTETIIKEPKITYDFGIFDSSATQQLVKQSIKQSRTTITKPFKSADVPRPPTGQGRQRLKQRFKTEAEPPKIETRYSTGQEQIRVEEVQREIRREHKKRLKPQAALIGKGNILDEGIKRKGDVDREPKPTMGTKIGQLTKPIKIKIPKQRITTPTPDTPTPDIPDVPVSEINIPRPKDPPPQKIKVPTPDLDFKAKLFGSKTTAQLGVTRSGYQPQAAALIFNITAPKIPDRPFANPLQLRPIIVKTKRKKKRKSKRGEK